MPTLPARTTAASLAMMRRSSPPRCTELDTRYMSCPPKRPAASEFETVEHPAMGGPAAPFVQYSALPCKTPMPAKGRITSPGITPKSYPAAPKKFHPLDLTVVEKPSACTFRLE